MNIMRQAWIRSIGATAVLGLVIFGSAGDMTWLPGWLYIAFVGASTILSFVGPLKVDEGLIAERMSSKPDQKGWDKIFVALVGVLTLAELIVPGLDHRGGWTPPLPFWTFLIGLTLAIFGTAMLMWAMRANRFFSAVIRIQNDRGHQVVSSGPYAWVRHPGYAFWMLRTIGCPLLFGSKWAFIPVGLFVVMFVLRTALEDATLKRELPGYVEYTKKVKWRLVPGVW